MSDRQTKIQLRQLLLQQRRSLSVSVWREKSDRLCDNLQSLPQFIEAKTILAYFSFRQEPDLSTLFVNFSDKKWGFPRCVDRSLVWHSWRSGDPLQKGAYGIQEPDPNLPILQPDEVDLILVPAVACDRQRYRLGYGGGFYDRLLSQPEWANKPTIGIIFDFAYLPQLPIEPWDRRLHGICTDLDLSIQ